MKNLFLWFFLLSSTCAFCVEGLPVCSEIGVELWGETLFVEGAKGTGKETTKETRERDPMPSFWNSSSEVFDSLHIKTASRKELSRVAVEIRSEKGSKKASFKLSPQAKGWWNLEKADFKKHIMPKKGEYPARLELLVYGQNSQALCSQTYKFGVVK